VDHVGRGHAVPERCTGRDRCRGRDADRHSVCARFVHAAGDIDLALYAAGDLTRPLAASATKGDVEVIVESLAAGRYDVRVRLDPRDDVNTSYDLHVALDTAGCP
jgi:hypothetical protein